MANAPYRRMRTWLQIHAADLALFMALLAVLAWCWHGPIGNPPGGLKAAARVAVHRHVGVAAHEPVDPAVSVQERSARAPHGTRDPG